MTLDCLRTLYAGLGYLTAEVFVVDNASADGSADAVREAFPQVTLIENPRNVGFGAANNQAMAQARGQFFLLLNSDAFPKPGAIPALVEYLQANPKVGVVGPKLLHADGSLQKSCYRFPTPAQVWRDNFGVSSVAPHDSPLGDYRHWAHDAERRVEWVIGACLLVRQAVYEQVGSFDERFFMYAEETDWQRRIAALDWEIVFTPTAVVAHHGGASGTAEHVRVKHNFFDSMDRYIQKHHGRPGLIAARLAIAVGSLSRTLLWAGVFLAVPKRRVYARAKIGLNSWLCVRQVTNWRLRTAS